MSGYLTGNRPLPLLLSSLYLKSVKRVRDNNCEMEQWLHICCLRALGII